MHLIRQLLLSSILLFLIGCDKPTEATESNKIDSNIITYSFSSEITKDEKESFIAAFNTWNEQINNKFNIKYVQTNPTVLISKRDMEIHTLGLQYPGHIDINSNYRYHCGFPYGIDHKNKTIDIDGLSLHEVGHLFGLHHLDFPNCMYKELHKDSYYLHSGDKQAIKSLYSVE